MFKNRFLPSACLIATIASSFAAIQSTFAEADDEWYLLNGLECEQHDPRELLATAHLVGITLSRRDIKANGKVVSTTITAPDGTNATYYRGKIRCSRALATATKDMQGFETAPTQSSEGNDVSSSEGQLESTGQVDRNGELASWEAQIQARIQRSWLRPPSAHSGIDCIAYVTQVPGGEVTNVRLGQCNGDATVRASIQAAAYRASPLPPPPDPALFQRDLEIQFKPVD